MSRSFDRARKHRVDLTPDAIDRGRHARSDARRPRSSSRPREAEVPAWLVSLESRVLDLPAVLGVLVTDGNGRLLWNRGPFAPSRGGGERLDTTLASIETTGAAIGLGPLETLAIHFSDGLVVTGQRRVGGYVSVLAGFGARTSLGLLLSQVARAVFDDAAAEATRSP